MDFRIALALVILLGCQPGTLASTGDPGDAKPAPDPEAPAAPGTCEGVDFAGRCEGSVAVWCQSGEQRRRDCAVVGQPCRYIDGAVGYYCDERVLLDAGFDAGGGERDSGSDAALTPMDAGARPDAGAGDVGTARDAGHDVGSDAGAPLPDPGDVAWTSWPEQHTAMGGTWGAALTDIVRHLPRSYGDTYYDSDFVTYGHETSHGIHAHVRNYIGSSSVRDNGFYCLDDRAALVDEPNIRKSQVGPFIPSGLRGDRYDLYITGSSSWDDTPLYVWDEWNSYVNGTEVAVDRHAAGLWREGWRDAAMGPLEFTVYAIAVAMAVERHDPTYFRDNTQFHAFLKWNARRAMRLFRAARSLPDFAWERQDTYYEVLRTGTAGATIRDFVARVYGAELRDELFEL